MPEKAASQPVSIRLEADVYEQLTGGSGATVRPLGEQLKHLVIEVLKDRDTGTDSLTEIELLQAEVKKLTSRVDRVLTMRVIDLEDEVQEIKRTDCEGGRIIPVHQATAIGAGRGRVCYFNGPG